MHPRKIENRSNIADCMIGWNSLIKAQKGSPAESYRKIPDRQIETSVVLADPPYD